MKTEAELAQFKAEMKLLAPRTGELKARQALLLADLDEILVQAGGAIPGTVADPVFDPAAGEYEDTVTVSLTSAAPLAEIRYTVNGDAPTATSTLYSEPIDLTETTTVKAKAFRSGWTASGVTEAVYTIVAGG